MKNTQSFVSVLIGLVLAGCNEYAFKDVKGFYSNPGNVEVSFRVVDAHTQESPDMTGKNINDYVRILEDGELLSLDEGHAVQMRNPKTMVFDMLLVLDLSGSVSKSLKDLQDAAISFVRKAFSKQNIRIRISIGTFDGSESPLWRNEPTDDVQALIETIRGLAPGGDPSTNLYGAIQKSYEKLKELPAPWEANTIRKKALVVFTDGKDRAGRVSESDARKTIERARAEFAQVSAVVVGSEISVDFLKAFGARNQGYFPVDRYSALASAFDEVALRLQRLAGTYFTVRICTPKRRGVHFINLVSGPHLDHPVDQANVEFVANGFTGGCSVDEESQWNRPGQRLEAPGLTDSEMAASRGFFSRFELFPSQVLIKENATRPASPATNPWIQDFSPRTRYSAVSCNLVFLGDAGNITPFTAFAVSRYGSYKRNYTDTGEPFHGFFLDLGEGASPAYRLFCNTVEDMLSRQATRKRGWSEPERYLLQALDVINGDV